ncbi:MAG: hypothetical protein LBN93_08040 [Candidatus Symbiothrix sp.]|jgi:nucleoid DNA-binding protein|nr:hypothetical protein [Candidatus Symbiothrix sp.]
MSEKELNITVTQASLQEAFVSELLSGESVIIPGLGYLEPQDLGGRHTVVFKAAAPADAVMKRLSVKSAQTGTIFAEAKEQISDVLHDNRTVNLPAIGIFKSAVNDRGDLRVTFTLAQSLRKLLNGVVEEKEVKEVKESNGLNETINQVESLDSISTGQHPVVETSVEKTVEVVEIVEIVPVVTNEKPVTIARDTDTVAEKAAPAEKKPAPVEKKPAFVPTPAPAPRMAHKPQRQQRSKIASIDGRVALLAACVVLLIIVIAVLLPAEKVGHEVAAVESKVTNLMDEAEKHYGNSAYWPYIYEANKNIISSPVNVPKTLKLTFPDLSEQGIDVKNAAEIRKAEVKGEIILRQLSQ